MINLNKWKIIAGLFSAYFIYQFSINWSFTENSFYIFLIVSILIAATVSFQGDYQVIGQYE